MKLLSFVFSLLLTFTGTITYGQNKQVLTYQDFLRHLTSEHPLAKQAKLKRQFANATTLQAKGSLDPKISASHQNKKFDDKKYFNHFQSKLVVPTILGIDFVAAFDKNTGQYLNPELKTPKNGLWTAGVEIDLIQGLFTNTRKTAIKQAKTYEDINEAQQTQMLNDLVFEASNAYLNWLQQYKVVGILENNKQVTQKYFENTKQAFINGEKSAIDTLEAHVNLQNIKNLSLNAELELNKAIQQLENHLWIQNQPAKLESNVIPAEDFINPINFNISQPEKDNLLNNNPILEEKMAKLAYIDLKNDLAKEKLKPKLKVKYNFLMGTNSENINPIYNDQNVKMGVDFSFPIFIRNERGYYLETKTEKENISLEIENKKNELSNKITALEIAQNNLLVQISNNSQMIIAYEKLLESEIIKFNTGESSIFLINKRQEKLMEAQQKQQNLEFKNKNNQLTYLYYTNTLLKSLE